MSAVGLAELTLHVTAGHTYRGEVAGVTGPAEVRVGGNVDDPIMVRLRDNQRTFVWDTWATGDCTLLITGWPGQPAKTTVRVDDLGPRRRTGQALVR